MGWFKKRLEKALFPSYPAFGFTDRIITQEDLTHAINQRLDYLFKKGIIQSFEFKVEYPENTIKHFRAIPIHISFVPAKSNIIKYKQFLLPILLMPDSTDIDKILEEQKFK